MENPKFDVQLAASLEQDLLSKHGPMMTGEALTAALGYPSQEAFRQAVARKTIPIPIFSIEKRRGKFALTKDVATWLAAQYADAIKPSPSPQNALPSCHSQEEH